jgi:hypothetical protein
MTMLAYSVAAAAGSGSDLNGFQGLISSGVP